MASEMYSFKTLCLFTCKTTRLTLCSFARRSCVKAPDPGPLSRATVTRGQVGARPDVRLCSNTLDIVHAGADCWNWPEIVIESRVSIIES